MLNVIYCWLLAVYGHPAQDENHGDCCKINNDRQSRCTDAISDPMESMARGQGPFAQGKL